MLKRGLFITIMALPVVMLFQNCSSGVDFANEADPALVSKINDDIDSDGDGGGGGGGGNETDGHNPEPGPGPVKDPVKDVVSEEQGSQKYICVLAGSGKSQLLHFDENVYSDVSRQKAVCTTKEACLNIVSQAFEVKEAKFFGGCGKNPHTVTLSGAEIMALVEKL